MQWWNKIESQFIAFYAVTTLKCSLEIFVAVGAWCSVRTHVGEIPRAERNLKEEGSNILLLRHHGAEPLHISLCSSGGTSWVEIFKGNGLTKVVLSRGHLDLKTRWCILQGIHKVTAHFHRCPPLRLNFLGGYKLLVLLQLYPSCLQMSDWTRMQTWYVLGSSWYVRTFLNISVSIYPCIALQSFLGPSLPQKVPPYLSILRWFPPTSYS
jgi:hypothetical protein